MKRSSSGGCVVNGDKFGDPIYAARPVSGSSFGHEKQEGYT
jgi:hypothetical protein